MLVCGTPTADGSSICDVCSTGFGLGCMPVVDVPADLQGGGDSGGGGGPVKCPCGPATGTGSYGVTCGSCGESAQGQSTPAWAVTPRAQRLPNPRMHQQMAADPVALGSGELVHGVTDVSFDSRGVPFSFTRGYRSGGLRSGALGPGWSHVFEERVVPVGDRFNREGVPAYCVEGLPEIRCVLRTDADGGVSLWTLDPVLRTFVPPAGEMGSIAALYQAPAYAQRARDVADLPPLEGIVIEHVSPGGVRRIYDVSGMLVSVTDEMGFGLVLTWERKTESQAVLDGPWTNVEMLTLRGEPTNSLEGSLIASGEVNLLNLHELVQVTDFYGRDFDFEYDTFVSGTMKRRRLVGIHHRGSEILHFGYESFARTEDVYLTSVQRRGFQAAGVEAQTGTVEYAYAREIFESGGLFQGSPGNYVSALAVSVDIALDASADRIVQCAGAGGASPSFAPEVNDRCAQRYEGNGPHPGQLANNDAETMWRVIERALADNIVRIAVDGDIEVESRFDVDPFSETFDHVVEQRYGQVPAPLETLERVIDSGRTVHVWHTTMPSSSLTYFAGDVLPAAVAGELPVVAGTATGDDEVVIPSVCDFPELELFPMFYPETPLQRNDMPSTLAALFAPPSVKASTASCAALAGQFARVADPAGLWPDDDGTLRAQREWQLNVVCRWVKETDRRGVDHWHGLNYEGSALVEVHPSPTASGDVVFKRRVNADGLIVEQLQPDGGKTTITFGMLDRLNRNLPTEIREDAATAAGLVPPQSESLGGGTTPTLTRSTTLTWDPYFQSPLTMTDPVTTHRWLYQWQEQEFRPAATQRWLRSFMNHGVPLAASTLFRGVDLDGDGVAYGESAGEVVHVIEGVALGGGTTGDVGTRTTRDETGRVTDTWSIAAVGNPALDFNRTSFRYYQNLAKAELGDLSIGNCKKPCGPLGEITRHRERTSTAANDLDVSFFAYDIHGAVRLQRENNDAATDIVTERNARGHVTGELRYGVESLSYTRDLRGRVVSVKHSTPDTPMEQSATAWGLDQTQLGSCEEVVEGACAGFEAFALSVFGAVRANAALPAALPGANYSIVVVDAEDNVIATVGPDGFESTVVRLLDGSVQSLTTVGTPNTVDTYVYDVMGRLVRESRGSSGTVLLRSHHRYDGFGRLVDTLTRAPLATTSFPTGTPTTGTVHSTAYDLGDRVVRVSEFGDSPAARRVLSLQRFELNAIGAPLFTHAHVASSLATTAVGKTNSGVDPIDVFATESFRYDSAQRVTRVEREGMSTPWTATYDHFGPIDLSSPTLSQVKVTHVPKLRTTQRIVNRRAEGNGAVPKQMTTTQVRNARQLVESLQWLDTDAPARSQLFTYDGRGRLVLSKDAANRTVETTYGRLSRVEKISEAGGARFTTFAYDTRGRVIERDPSDGPATDYDYDVTGRVVFEQTGDISLSVVRDAAGRLLSRDQNVRGAVRTLSLSFDPNRVRPFKVLVDGIAAKEFTRDGLDRPTIAVDGNLVFAAESPSGFAASRPVVRSVLTYDAAGRVKQDQTTALFPASSPTLPGQDVTIANLTTTWPTSNFRGPSTWGLFSGELRDASYNAASGLPSAIGHTGASGQKISVALSWQGGQHVRSAIGTTNVVARERDGLGQIRATTLSFGSTVPFRENVLRGPEGHVTSRLTTASLLVTRAHAHQYDPLQRLKQTKQDMASTQNVTTFRGFYDDAAINETTTPVTTSINATVNHTLGDGDTLTNATTDEQGRTYSASFDINEAGIPPEVVNGGSVGRDGRDRIQTDNTLSYTFDALDRLVLVRRGTGTDEELRIAYDGLGRRRLERRLENVGSGSTVDVALEYIGGNVIEERDLDNNKVFLGMMHVPGELDAPITAVPGPLVSGGERYLLGVAVRGDITTALSFKAAATVVEQQILDAYGEREARTATGSLCVEGKEVGSTSKPQQTCTLSILNRFGITGARQHARTKLVDLRNRVYAPHLRGFLTKDPLGSIDSDGQWNYVAQDPINMKDPLGLDGSSGSGRLADSDDDTELCPDGKSACWKPEPAAPAPEPPSPSPAPATPSVCDDACVRARANAQANAEFRRQRAEDRAFELRVTPPQRDPVEPPWQSPEASWDFNNGDFCNPPLACAARDRSGLAPDTAPWEMPGPRGVAALGRGASAGFGALKGFLAGLFLRFGPKQPYVRSGTIKLFTSITAPLPTVGKRLSTSTALGGATDADAAAAALEYGALHGTTNLLVAEIPVSMLDELEAAGLVTRTLTASTSGLVTTEVALSSVAMTPEMVARFTAVMP